MQNSKIEQSLISLSEKLNQADKHLQSGKYGSTSRSIDACKQIVNKAFQSLDMDDLEISKPNSTDEPDRYRWDGSTGTLYEYDTDQNAYIFAAAGNGKTEAETIADYEET